MGHDRIVLFLLLASISVSAEARPRFDADPDHTLSTDLFPEFSTMQTPSSITPDFPTYDAELTDEPIHLAEDFTPDYQPEEVDEGQRLALPEKKDEAILASPAMQNIRESFKPNSTSGLPVTNNFRKRAYVRTFYNTAAMDDGRRIEIIVDGKENAKARIIEKDNTKSLVPDGHYEIHANKLRRLQNNNFELIDDTSILLSIYKGQVINYLPRWAVVAGEFENFEVAEPVEEKPAETPKAVPAEPAPEEAKPEKQTTTETGE